MRKHLSDIRFDDDEDEINLTPMLDVVFIMLIFFIVTASFIKETGINVNRPDAPLTQTTPDESNILVVINGIDEIYIENRIIDPKAVKANITRLHAANPDGSVVIQADRKSTNKKMIEVMDASRAAGVFDISIAGSR